MKISNNEIYVQNLTYWILLIVFLGIMWKNIEDKIESTQKYKVYYEYNIIQGDTIPCGTVYVEIK